MSSDKPDITMLDILCHLEGMRQDMRRIEKRMDTKFQQIDKRFDAIDQKFDAIDKRFDKVDYAFERLYVNRTTDVKRLAALEEAVGIGS